MIKTILFDLDGTLLPMNQDIFVKAYFKSLAEIFINNHLDRPNLIETVIAGTNRMVENNGEKFNEEVFWVEYDKAFRKETLRDKSLIDLYYENDFDKLKQVCGFNPETRSVIEELKRQGYQLILATNPVFPMLAQEKRVEWAGLNKEDFKYITSYENSHYCKPNPKYYEEILNKLELNPKECIMVGNDTTEDAAAKTLGMDFFLLTNCLLNKERKDISQYPRGSFMQLLDYIEKIS
ncbi:MAG: HAD family hydrolase [Anaeroplasmataceae bacterium]|nr:HAD family hydrolase [Anaeroplasmataceae bacterium]